VARACGDAAALPFRDSAFDLVFYQNTLLWVRGLQEAIGEAARVLRPGGALVAVEPDFGGMMEHPDLGLRALWLHGLSAAGADPEVGRKIPAACESAGLGVWVELTHIPQPARPEAVRLLVDLPLSPAQRARGEAAARRIETREGVWSVFVHVPYLLVVAHRGDS
jgi:SAM-dependent methyltransferase